MSKRSRKHRWSIDECPHLEDHSKAKHEILSGYIQKYLSIVCQSRKIQQYNITLIDGFAGGGFYQAGKKGSPLVMMDAVMQADFDINKGRIKRIEIKPNYFFVEKDKRNYELLKNIISKNNVEEHVTVQNGDFNSCLFEIIPHIQKRNPKGGGGSIFFLDQDGYSAVSIEALNFIRKKLPKAEIIINIGVSWLIDFIKDSTVFEKTISKMGLPA